jgi:hypothetical protein
LPRAYTGERESTAYQPEELDCHVVFGIKEVFCLPRPQIMRAKQAAEKLDLEGGGGFNHRIKPIESTMASATEERILPIHLKTGFFPQPVKPAKPG